MENSVMLNAVCNEPVSLKVVQEPFYRKGFSPFVNKQTGTWWEYDDDKKGFFDTGIIARGRDGNDYVITWKDYDTIVERTLSNVNPTLDEKLSSKLPKSPTEWGIWTPDEQAAACERIGIERLGKWEEIVTVTTEEAVSIFTVDKDTDGNPFSLSQIICEFIIPTETTSKTRHVYFGLEPHPFKAFSRVPVSSSNIVDCGAVTYARIVGGRVICEAGIGQNLPNRYQIGNNTSIFNGYGNLEVESFDSISMFTFNDAFPAGCQIIIRGIRK